MYKKQRHYAAGLNKQVIFKHFNNMDCKKESIQAILGSIQIPFLQQTQQAEILQKRRNN